MKSAAPGPNTSHVEVTNVSPNGLWLFLGEREFFLSFKDFPWFEHASIRDIANVELPSARHLYWPALDVDLAVESLTHPERYPLVSQTQPASAPRPTKTRRGITKSVANRG